MRIYKFVEVHSYFFPCWFGAAWNIYWPINWDNEVEKKSHAIEKGQSSENNKKANE